MVRGPSHAGLLKAPYKNSRVVYKGRVLADSSESTQCDEEEPTPRGETRRRLIDEEEQADDGLLVSQN